MLKLRIDAFKVEILRRQREVRSKILLDALASISRCLVIVLDKKTDIITTEASSSACDRDFSFLQTVAKDIHQLRIEDKFRQAVNICSENVWQLVLDGKKQAKESQSDKSGQGLIDVLNADIVKDVYSKIFLATKKSSDLARLERNDTSQEIEQSEEIETWFANEIEPLDKFAHRLTYEYMPGQHESVFCWAIDTKSWKLKPPCLRCQRMYCM